MQKRTERERRNMTSSLSRATCPPALLKTTCADAFQQANAGGRHRRGTPENRPRPVGRGGERKAVFAAAPRARGAPEGAPGAPLKVGVLRFSDNEGEH